MLGVTIGVFVVGVLVAGVWGYRLLDASREEARTAWRVAAGFERERNQAYARILDLEEYLLSQLPRIGPRVH